MHMFIYIWDVCESTDFIRCCVYIVIPALNYINHPLHSRGVGVYPSCRWVKGVVYPDTVLTVRLSWSLDFFLTVF